MAKSVKNKWLGARADAALDAEVKNYIKAAEMDMGELVRKSVREYMVNHPVKGFKPQDSTAITKPGAVA